jgi:hypothetical protein
MPTTMTPEEREAVYDTEIAPELSRLAARCQDCGMSLVAEVEWNPAETAGGLTVTLAEGSSFAIRLVKLAADVKGNIDSLFIALRKSNTPGIENTLVMRVLSRDI